MTFKIAKTEFAALLSFVAPYFSAKNRPLCISIQDGNLNLFTSDRVDGGSVLVSAPLGKKIKDRDWFAVDGPNLRELVALAEDGDMIEVSFDSKTSSIALAFPSSRAEFRCIPNLTAPSAVKFGKPGATIKGRDLNVLATLTEAASDDEARPTLAGVFIAPHKSELETAAADGFVLSYTSIESQDAKDAAGAVYSAAAINRAKRSLKPADDEEIKLGFDKGGLTVTAQRVGADVTVHIPVVHPQFVDYKQILNIPASLEVEIPTAELDRMIKRMKALEGNVYLQVTGGRFWYLIKNENTGSAMESFDVGAQTESPLMFFQLSTLKDVTKACVPNGKVTVVFPENDRQPLRIKGAATALAMPLVCELKESPFKKAQPALM